MIHQSIWYYTKLPSSIIDIICSEIEFPTEKLQQATTGPDKLVTEEVLQKRKSKVYWTPPNHWIQGFCYHYVLQANLTNFKYDIQGFDNNTMQYTVYNQGDYYGWHFDDDITSPSVMADITLNRKLSFSLQLSDPSEYDGGVMQIRSFEDYLYEVPKERGVIVVFDSRARHRVTKIKKGCRKSLVGWVGGPRWK